ncbi:MAG: hypothetical protein ACYDBJ_15370, partial [Aggregatilineales bacterium]
LGAWREQVEGLVGWEVHRHEGYRAVPVDVTAFWRPQLQSTSLFYHRVEVGIFISGLIGDIVRMARLSFIGYLVILGLSAQEG